MLRRGVWDRLTTVRHEARATTIGAPKFGRADARQRTDEASFQGEFKAGSSSSGALGLRLGPGALGLGSPRLRLCAHVGIRIGTVRRLADRYGPIRKRIEGQQIRKGPVLRCNLRSRGRQNCEMHCFTQARRGAGGRNRVGPGQHPVRPRSAGLGAAALFGGSTHDSDEEASRCGSPADLGYVGYEKLAEAAAGRRRGQRPAAAAAAAAANQRNADEKRACPWAATLRVHHSSAELTDRIPVRYSNIADQRERGMDVARMTGA